MHAPWQRHSFNDLRTDWHIKMYSQKMGRWYQLEISSSWILDCSILVMLYIAKHTFICIDICVYCKSRCRCKYFLDTNCSTISCKLAHKMTISSTLAFQLLFDFSFRVYAHKWCLHISFNLHFCLRALFI